MSNIIIGCLGFLLIHLFDFVSLKKLRRGIKPLTWLAGTALLIYGIIMVCLSNIKLPLPDWSLYLGWALLGISLSLLIYSLFVNLPFRRTYVAPGVNNQLITTGMYALVRHPGVHWFVLFMLSLIMVSESKLLVIGAAVWTLLDIVLVVVQDKFVFTHMFSGYTTYQKETPMLLPNGRSLKMFLSSLRVFRV